MSTAQTSDSDVFKLMDLPPEIVHKILTGYQYSPSRLRIIRLVCHQTNEWIEHAALNSLNLSRKLLSELEHIALRPNAFDRVTKILVLPRATEASRVMQPAVQGVVCRIIRKMAGVQTVHWDLCHTPIELCTYEALSQLPLLEKLVIQQPQQSAYWDEGNFSIGEKIRNTNLKSISIGCRASSTPALTKCFHDLVANNAGLEELNSWNQPGSIDQTFDFGTIVGDTPRKAAFRPSLRALHAGNLQLATSPNVLKYLKNLTTLCISNLHPDHDTLWPAFHSCGIMLKDLIIERPTERLTDYLLEYLGLEKLALTRQGRDHRVGVSNDTKLRFLEKGIAHHRGSLAHIEIMFYPHNYQRHSHLVLWGLDERQIAWLERFPKLTTLTVSFAHDGEEVPQGTKISMSDALAGLFTRLAPALHEVELACGMSEDYGKDGRKKSDYGLIRTVRNFEFTTRPRSPVEMRLKLFDAIWRISYNQKRGKYHFVLDSTVGEEEKD